MESKINTDLKSKNPVKTPAFKTVAHTFVLAAVIFTCAIVAGNIYKNVKKMYTSQPAGAGISCFFDMID